MAMSLRIGIVGATGYSGAVAARLVATHPSFRLAFATSDKLAGASVADYLGLPLPEPLTFVPNAEAAQHENKCDAVFLATPSEASAELAPKFIAAGRRVVDLSGAHRPGVAPEGTRAHYGLPELFGAPPAGVLVANPGCYPTAAILAIGPLVREGLVEPTGIVVDGKSGVTGA
jgi:N-acetyl-gamma-glutamyl-phosphate reductase